MQQLSAAGRQKIEDIAQRHGFSSDAVASMFAAVRAGNGRMAQFSHAEFGGSGQWMRGGMTMLSNMLDTALKARVDRLCDELATLIAGDAARADDDRSIGRDREVRSADGEGERLFTDAPVVARESWWPTDLGSPDSSGAQNAVRYAYFARPRRLAIDADGHVTIYDTLDHCISGVSQQQSARGSLTFSSSHGNVDLATLPVVRGAREPAPASDVLAPIERLAEPP